MTQSLELIGNIFVLYFEGERIEEQGSLAFDDEAPSGRSFYAGKARVTRIPRQQSRVFDFRTETQDGPHRFDPALFLTPGVFESLRGHAWPAVCRLMQDNAQSLIDCLAAHTLATIESWESEELRRKGDWKRLLSPPPIMFGTLPVELIDQALLGRPVLVFPDN